MAKRGIIFGWMSGAEDRHQVYHTHCRQWSNAVTTDPSEAYVFKNLAEAEAWFKKINLKEFWPGWENGYIQFFDAETFQMLII